MAEGVARGRRRRRGDAGEAGWGGWSGVCLRRSVSKSVGPRSPRAGVPCLERPPATEIGIGAPSVREPHPFPGLFAGSSRSPRRAHRFPPARAPVAWSVRAVPASPSARALSLAPSRSGPIYEARSHHVLMSLCPALAAAAAQTPPRELCGEGRARGARGSKLCWRWGSAAAPAPGPEGTSLSGPRHLLLFLLLRRRRRRGPQGPHRHDLALLPDTLTPWPSQEGARACAVPDLGPLITRAPAAPAPCAGVTSGPAGWAWREGGTWGGGARGGGAPGPGVRPPAPPPPRSRPPPAAAGHEPGPGAGKGWGPHRAASDPFATWRRPRGHLSSALGHRLASRRAPPPAPAIPARRGPLGRAPPARPRLQTVGLRRRLALRLAARRAPSPAARGTRSLHLLAGGGRPPPGPGGGRAELGDSRLRRLGILGAPGGRGRN